MDGPLEKMSEGETFSATYYDTKQVKISQEKHLLMGFPLSYYLTSAGGSARQGCSVDTN